MTNEECLLIIEAWFKIPGNFTSYLKSYQALYQFFQPNNVLFWSERLPVIEQLAMISATSNNSLALAAYLTVSNN